MRYLILAIVVLLTSACSSWDYSANRAAYQSTGVPVHWRPNLDRPWDPKDGATLLDQASSPKGGALVQCCGHLSRCETWQSPRC